MRVHIPSTSSLKARALICLSRREYSRVELRRKLTPYTDDAQKIETLLDALQNEGVLSNARFAESLAYRRAPRFGANRIIGELKQHALDAALVERISAQLRETELGRAAAVREKKYRALPATFAERVKQSRFLAMRGFSHETIAKLFHGFGED